MKRLLSGSLRLSTLNATPSGERPAHIYKNMTTWGFNKSFPIPESGLHFPSHMLHIKNIGNARALVMGHYCSIRALRTRHSPATLRTDDVRTAYVKSGIHTTYAEIRS
eukprot:scaffold4522_cov104-Cylindrotheca_fusiformis.AAC.2